MDISVFSSEETVAVSSVTRPAKNSAMRNGVGGAVVYQSWMYNSDTWQKKQFIELEVFFTLIFKPENVCLKKQRV